MKKHPSKAQGPQNEGKQDYDYEQDYEYEQERWGIPQPILILILLVIMTDGWESMNVLQRRAGMGGRCGASWPKGVFRFKSFEEADEWWTKKMVWRSWHGATSDLIHLAP